MNDKQKLIDILMDTLPAGTPWEGHVRDLVDHLIANGVTVQRWIPVTERLPEGECIAFGYQGEMIIGYVGIEVRGGVTLYCAENEGEYLYDVTHWMPLPEPPKEELP